MDEQHGPKKDQPDPSPSAPVKIPEPIPSPQTAPANAQQLLDVEKEMSGFEKATLRWAKTAVSMSLLAAVFVCLQWWEMHTGSRDTHNLADAAGKQATWTQNLAANMQTQADRTKDLADRMKEQADRTKDVADRTRDLANDSAGQLVTMQSQLELANRPWIKIVSVTTRDFPGPQPAALTFKQYGPNNTWANLVVSISIENIGPSVAVNTDIEPILLTPEVVQHDWGKDILAQESAICANARKRQPKHDVGAVTIFPNDDPFERHWTLMFAVDPKRIQHPKETWSSNRAGYLALSVGGCITYQSAVSKKVYQTGFIYDLTGRATGINGFIGVIPLGADIPSKDLHFDRNEAGYFAQ